jgi:hypothetical protein
MAQCKQNAEHKHISRTCPGNMPLSRHLVSCSVQRRSTESSGRRLHDDPFETIRKLTRQLVTSATHFFF